MKIGGFQKFSLLDYPGQLAAIVFAQGCNFRCPYCHNPAVVDPLRYGHLLDTEAVLHFLYRRRKKLGAVVVSGGEPTLQEDLLPFLRLLKAMRFKVKLDTNGSVPEVLEAIAAAKLVDYFAMDVKAPLPLYKLVSGSDIDTALIMQSMDVIRRAGVSYEFRSTFFDALLSVNDLSLMQELLKPGDKFTIQECRYGNNLEELSKPNQEAGELPLNESPAFRSLLGWGVEHSVQISIRSL
jgi:pyruvate formate lyase activating enzyme